MTTTVEVNIPLGQFATALAASDMTYPYSDDPRVYRQESKRREMLILMAQGLVEAGEPIEHVMIIVELEARKQFPTASEWDSYIDQFREAVER